MPWPKQYVLTREKGIKWVVPEEMFKEWLGDRPQAKTRKDRLKQLNEFMVEDLQGEPNVTKYKMKDDVPGPWTLSDNLGAIASSPGKATLYIDDNNERNFTYELDTDELRKVIVRLAYILSHVSEEPVDVRKEFNLTTDFEGNPWDGEE